MVSLLQSVIPADKRSMSPNAPLTILRAEEYKATVEFLWAPLLVESNSDGPFEHADILVFNTFLWWRQGPVKLLWTDAENGACEELDGLGAMELAMGAWTDWVSSKADPLKKRVFFCSPR
ncbi:hypothetical protein K1719_038387 [Acacia pycnantha]|nr:hypothetical protein K1719_038387 [Acacia pycnantha]